jgi:hypothetical protein
MEGFSGSGSAAGATSGLRVGPRSLGGSTEFAQHQANGREVNERQRMAGAVRKVLGQAPTAIEPGECPFHNPAFGEHDQTSGLIPSWDDFGCKPGPDCGQGFAEHRALRSPSGAQFCQ